MRSPTWKSPAASLALENARQVGLHAVDFGCRTKEPTWDQRQRDLRASERAGARRELAAVLPGWGGRAAASRSRRSPGRGFWRQQPRCVAGATASGARSDAGKRPVTGCGRWGATEAFRDGLVSSFTARKGESKGPALSKQTRVSEKRSAPCRQGSASCAPPFFNSRPPKREIWLRRTE